MADATTLAGIVSQMGGNRYFNADSGQVSVPFFAGLLKSFVKLRPKNGLVNIVDNHRWKNNGNASEVPKILATELEIDYGLMYQNIANIINVSKSLVNEQAIDPYLQIYKTTKTGFSYNFPWLLNNGDNIRTISNNWEKSNDMSSFLKALPSGPISNFIGTAAGAAAKVMSPGVGMEPVKQFTDTTPQRITVTFPLYNTGSIDEAYDNFTFVQLFTFQNLKTRTSFLTFRPPKVYTLDSQSLGGLYIPVAFVSEFKIDSIGTTRRLSDFRTKGSNEILIPEAYKVSITFEEVLPQSSNIFAANLGGQKVSVVNNSDNNGQSIFGPIQDASAFTSYGNAFTPKYPITFTPSGDTVKIPNGGTQVGIPDGGIPVGNPYYPNDNRPSITITGAENVGPTTQ